VAVSRHRAIPEIALVVVFENRFAGEKDESRGKTRGDNAYQNQTYLSRTTRQGVGDELRETEKIDKTGKNEDADKPENRHLADVVLITEQRRQRRQNGTEGGNEQAS
jgi:hypothetical protein